MQIHICDNQNYTNNNNTNTKNETNYKQFAGSENFLNSSDDYHNLSSSDGGDKTIDDVDMDAEQTEEEKISGECPPSPSLPPRTKSVKNVFF